MQSTNLLSRVWCTHQHGGDSRRHPSQFDDPGKSDDILSFFPLGTFLSNSIPPPPAPGGGREGPPAPGGMLLGDC
jgi:hypothetical protein